MCGIVAYIGQNNAVPILFEGLQRLEYRGYDSAGVAVIGISPDGAAKHQKFRQKYGLKFPLLSDPGHKVMEAYGAWGEKTLYGKKSLGVIRSTFLVDAKGVITKAWYNVRADGHAAKVLELVKESKAK